MIPGTTETGMLGAHVRVRTLEHGEVEGICEGRVPGETGGYLVTLDTDLENPEYFHPHEVTLI